MSYDNLPEDVITTLALAVHDKGHGVDLEHIAPYLKTCLTPITMPLYRGLTVEDMALVERGELRGWRSFTEDMAVAANFAQCRGTTVIMTTRTIGFSYRAFMLDLMVKDASFADDIDHLTELLDREREWFVEI